MKIAEFTLALFNLVTLLFIILVVNGKLLENVAEIDEVRRVNEVQNGLILELYSKGNLELSMNQ